MTTNISSSDPATRMRIAFEGVINCQQVIFSLVSELNVQGYTTDAASLQALLASLQGMIPTIQSDVLLGLVG
jgi:hypothetical protein